MENKRRNRRRRTRSTHPHPNPTEEEDEIKSEPDKENLVVSFTLPPAPPDGNFIPRGGASQGGTPPKVLPPLRDPKTFPRVNKL